MTPRPYQDARDAEWARFIEGHTVLQAPPLLPELRLYSASAVTPMWTATQEWLDRNLVEPPYWAFAWPGGQAVARHLLDHPELVRGREVLDLAAGSGLVAIAAALAGAARVIAIDLDPLALCAAKLNAEVNAVALELWQGSMAEPLPGRAELVTAGDVFYDATIADAALTAIAAQLGCGDDLGAPCPLVLVGDPGRAYLPEGFELVTEIDVPVASDVEASETKRTRVLTVTPASPAMRARRPAR